MTAPQQQAGASAPRPIHWPIMPEAAAFARFRQQHPTDAADPHLWRRWARAAHLYQTGGLSRDLGGYRLVASQYTAGEHYTVTTGVAGRCECGDATWRSRWCKHELAAFMAQCAEQPQQQATA